MAKELTFKSRVTRFWDWYAANAERIYAAIDEKRSPELSQEISAKFDELAPGAAWVFGPGAEGKGHSLTYTGEANPHKQLLAAYWKSQAPVLPGWTFFASRQPSAQPEGHRFNISGLDFEAKAFWLTPAVNVERQRIDITAWHANFAQSEDRLRWFVLYLMLDEALGEIGTQRWIGKVEMNDQKLAGAIPLGELPGFVARVQAEHGWKIGAPGEEWMIYRINEERPDRPRGDIFVGRTNMMALINEFNNAAEFGDPLAGSGADYVYVAFDAGIMPKGKEADFRGEIEDAIVAALEPAASGRTLGGAMGRRMAYLDFLLYDGAESLRLVVETLQRVGLPTGTAVNYFAFEKRGHRVVL